MNIREEIINITAEYLEDTINYEKLSVTTKRYKDILTELCESDLDTEGGREDIHLDTGKALGTFWAALCIDDIIRTRQFIRGIDKAIKDKLMKKEQISILYAGTGPFATLLLPFILRYPKQKINYTLLEVNPLTLELLKKVISKLDLTDRNITLVNEDATKYKVDSNTDIIISETMQNALAKEQQVPIFYNLMSQVNSDTLFIPEEIEIFVGVKKQGIPAELTQKEDYQKLNKVFEIGMKSVDQVKGKTPDNLEFPEVQTLISAEKIQDSNHLLLITELQIYKDEKIERTESGLTMPLTIEENINVIDNSIVINTNYTLTPEPKLEFKIER